MSNALNVIGKLYNADAVLIGRAYDYQDELRRVGGRLDYIKECGIQPGVDDVAKAYVMTMQSDRRYRLHINASSGNSAIVTYKGTRYYVESVYNANEKSRTHYVSYAR